MVSARRRVVLLYLVMWIGTGADLWTEYLSGPLRLGAWLAVLLLLAVTLVHVMVDADRLDQVDKVLGETGQELLVDGARVAQLDGEERQRRVRALAREMYWIRKARRP